jgi:hypothetical protein
MIKSRRMRWAGHVAQMGEKRYMWHTGGKARRQKDYLKNQDIGGWIILKWILDRIGWCGLGWTDLAQDWDQWRALVNTVMNLWVP